MRRRSGAREACDGNVIHSHGNDDVSKRVNARGLTDTMLYPELFKAFEDVRWTFERDINVERVSARATRRRTGAVDQDAITEWEKRFVGMILKNLSSLFGQTFESVERLNRFCKSLAAG